MNENSSQLDYLNQPRYYPIGNARNDARAFSGGGQRPGPAAHGTWRQRRLRTGRHAEERQRFPFVTPAIDPFSAKNRELSDREIREFLRNYKIPTDRPLVTQISRFDRWKDPMGVIEAFRKAREEVDCTLVLIGNNASDDPEGGKILETIESVADEDIIVLAADDPTLVNALQRSAAVVLQKSTRSPL